MGAYFNYRAKAKVNLFLHVLSLEDNGFYTLESLVYFPKICDTLDFYLDYEKSVNIIDGEGEFFADLPDSSSNLIIKVIEYFQSNFNIKQNLRVILNKRLPIGGGLGGGSSNAAVTILAMNQIFQLGLGFDDLIEIAKLFGSDVPSCLYQESNFFYSFGEKTKKVILPSIPMLLINPKQPMFTKDVFRDFGDNIQNFKPSQPIVNNIDRYDLSSQDKLIYFLRSVRNDLTQSSISLNPNIANILKDLEHTNALVARMSGSGSTCFAIYDNNEDLQFAFEKIKLKYSDAWIAVSTNSDLDEI